MKKYVIWLILFHLCYCKNIDYSDYFPDSVPFQVKKTSPEYKEVMKNLCDNWHSPISYLKKRGYMPNNIKYNPKENPKENDAKSGNYFFFPDYENDRAGKSIVFLQNEDSNEADEVKTENISTPEAAVTETPNTDEATTDNSGIIHKVKDKFLSIFSHKNKEGTLKEAFDMEDTEFIDNDSDDDYEISDKRIFTRSTNDKSGSGNSNCPSENMLSNLTTAEICFIKNFIEWFKKYKTDVKFLSSINSNITTTTEKSSSLKDNEAKANTTTTKPDETKSTAEFKQKVQNTTESSIKSVSPTSATSSTKPTTECMDFKSDSSTTAKPSTTTVKTTQGDISKNISSKNGGNGKSPATNITVDLEINQKNGTGEEVERNKTLHASVRTDNKKYNIKSKFLAHLHHSVDEVGKPPHKPLDLDKIQSIIDKSKQFATVMMSGGNQTTECVPLQLNDLSFDLEWNKVNTLPRGRDKLNILDLPYANEVQGQSLASKFLQEVNSYPRKNDDYLITPYADNFLDYQQALPNYWDLPLKSTNKRELASSRLKRNDDTISYTETENADNDLTPYEQSSKRRIKGKFFKGFKRRNKKKKQKNDVPSETLDDIPDETRANGFDAFDELRDIQFRVNDNDEEAISTFIANLNSPPEVFSFDVDKYLRTAKENIEPKSQEFQFDSPETRTFYEFLNAPAVENEVLPLIEPPIDSKMEVVDNKRSRKSLEKRDLLRQYIKGVSSALTRNYEDLAANIECNKNGGEKTQRSLEPDTFRPLDPYITNTNVEPLENIVNANDVSSINFFLPNDANYLESEPKNVQQNQDALPVDYSPQSLEIDLDLDKKFRDLSIGKRYNNDLYRNVNSKNVEKTSRDIEEEETIESK